MVTSEKTHFLAGPGCRSEPNLGHTSSLRPGLWDSQPVHGLGAAHLQQAGELVSLPAVGSCGTRASNDWQLPVDARSAPHDGMPARRQRAVHEFQDFLLRSPMERYSNTEGAMPLVASLLLKALENSDDFEPIKEPQAAARFFKGLQERKCVASPCTPENSLVAHALGLLGGLKT